MSSNNVTRLLDSKKIAYRSFTLPPEKLGAFETAHYLQVPAEIVYKSIIIKREKPGKYIIAVIPGNREVDLKLVASAISEKKVWLTSQSEAETATGLLTGGISPLALTHKGFLVILDSTAQDLEGIHISGGQRGLNLLLHPKDLIKLTNARVAAISS